jgi:predicted nucleic acid-binding protein
VIVYALTGANDEASAASEALEDAASQRGTIVVSAPVYAELLAMPHATRETIDAFIAEARIRVDWEISNECWTAAGIAYAAYARRRRRQKLDSPRRILADFIIGAHSLTVGSILTADSSFYRTNFPGLRVLSL